VDLEALERLVGLVLLAVLEQLVLGDALALQVFISLPFCMSVCLSLWFFLYVSLTVTRIAHSRQWISTLLCDGRCERSYRTTRQHGCYRWAGLSGRPRIYWCCWTIRLYGLVKIIFFFFSVVKRRPQNIAGSSLCWQVSAAADGPARRAALRVSCSTLSVKSWRPSPVCHTERPPKLTTLVAVDVQLRNSVSQKFGTKFQREVVLFLEIPELPSNTM